VTPLPAFCSAGVLFYLSETAPHKAVDDQTSIKGKAARGSSRNPSGLTDRASRSTHDMLLGG
jgi:hypothetical protein